MRWRSRTVLLATLLAPVACKRGPEHPYPPDVVENFMTACRTHAAESVCACSIDKIQRRYSADEFHAFEQRMAQGDTPKELIDLVADCRGR